MPPRRGALAVAGPKLLPLASREGLPLPPTDPGRHHQRTISICDAQRSQTVCRAQGRMESWHHPVLAGNSIERLCDP